MQIRKLARQLALAGALLGVPVSSHAQDRSTTDILIDVLIRKGVLTNSEAADIRQEVSIVAEAEQARALEAAVEAAAPRSSVPMPKSLDNLKLYGDARFRYQGEEVNDARIRNRWRYRVRFGADYSFRESPFSMGLRLETADANDSTNINFGGFFDKSDDALHVGLAYLDYSGENLSVTLGKHKRPFEISDAWWDSDLNPEGLSESFSAGDWTFNFGQYVIDEERENRSGAGNDDFLFVAQAAWSNGEGLSFAPLFLVTTNGESNVAESAEFTGENAIEYFRNFAVVALPFEYAFKGANGTPHSVYGAIGSNLKGDDAVQDVGSPYYSPVDADGQSLFGNIGYTYGAAKKAGQWQAGIEYRYIGGASYTPNLSDSDFAKNSLNHAGFLLSYQYAITEYFKAGLTYMDSETIDDDYAADVVANRKTKLLQVDAAVSF